MGWKKKVSMNSTEVYKMLMMTINDKTTYVLKGVIHLISKTKQWVKFYVHILKRIHDNEFR